MKGARGQQPAQTLEHSWIIVNNGNLGTGHRHDRLCRRVRLPVELTLGPIAPETSARGRTRTSSLGAARPLPPSADIGSGGQSVGQAAQFCLGRLALQVKPFGEKPESAGLAPAGRFVRAGKRFRHYFVGVRPHGMDGPEAARRVGTKTSRFAVLRRTCGRLN